MTWIIQQTNLDIPQHGMFLSICLLSQSKPGSADSLNRIPMTLLNCELRHLSLSNGFELSGTP
jgi:hypothetical protein